MFSFLKKFQKVETGIHTIPQNDDPKTLASNLYRQNIEISTKNKTLSLLSKLYEISILSLAPKDLASKLSSTVQSDLSFELVGIMLYSKEKNELVPLAFVSSERLRTIQDEFKTFFNTLPIPVTGNAFLEQIIRKKTMGYSENLENIWDSLVPNQMLVKINSGGHVRSSIIYPLIIQEEVIGVLVLSLNRLYTNLVDYEKTAINSFINVVAVALDKALLYEQLKVANEELKALDLARAEFISIASHQLRTPPATVKWYLSAIIHGDYDKVPEGLVEPLKKTQQTNNHLISLIEDMLNVSRIERGKMEFLFESISVEPQAQMAFDQLVPIAHDKKLQFTYEPPATPLPKIMADKEKLQQVMNNLIDNALKYTKTGSVKVKLFKKGDEIHFHVTDSGKGISLDDQKTIFQKYTRGKESIKQSAGLGLGLYVAKIIIEQHKGKIWAESVGEGQGSTFAFSLPISSGLKQTTLVDLAEQQGK